MNRIALTGLAAAAMAALPWSTPASAAPDQARESATRADVDGDGQLDAVSPRQISEERMLLRVGLRGEFVDATAAGNARNQPVLPVDVDGDRSDELMVPEAVGANTITYTAWGYSAEAGLHPVRTADGEPMRLFEGGGIAAVSTYGCSPANAERELVVVGAQLTGGNSYRGQRVTYAVRDGVATPVDRVDVEAADRADPRLRADPATCAPLPRFRWYLHATPGNHLP